MGALWRFVLIVLLGLAGSVISGLIKYGGEIFNPQSIGFAYYIVFGFSASFIFAFYHIWSLTPTVVGALGVTTALFVLIAVFVPFWPVINLVLWLFGINLSVIILAFLFERKLAYFKQWKFIVIGFMYGSVFVLLTLLVGIITKLEAMPPKLFQDNFLDGLLLGIGLGLGIEVAESFVHSVDLHQQEKRSGRKGY